MVASKVAEMPARSVARDLIDNHQRAVSLEQLQQVTVRVGELAREQQEHLPMEEAALPSARRVRTTTIGVDAASLLMSTAADEGAADRRKRRRLDWRMAMVGTISFYDAQGERLHTLYAAQSPPECVQEGKVPAPQRRHVARPMIQTLPKQSWHRLPMTSINGHTR